MESGDDDGPRSFWRCEIRGMLTLVGARIETREPTVEIAHDALLRAWHRLRAWVAEARDDLRTQRQLATAAREWRDAGRDPSFLVRGARMERFESLSSGSGLALTPAEREFLDVSVSEET